MAELRPQGLIFHITSAMQMNGYKQYRLVELHWLSVSIHTALSHTLWGSIS